MNEDNKQSAVDPASPNGAAAQPQDAAAENRRPSDENDAHQHGPAYYYGQQTVGGGGAPLYSSAPYSSAPYYSSSAYPRYGSYAAYGTYGPAYDGVLPYYSGSNARDDSPMGSSILGPLSARRILRIMLQKWPTLVVAVLLGLGAGFAYFKAAPVTYKAQCTIAMQVKRPRRIESAETLNTLDSQGTTEEIFNTRLALLRRLDVIKLVAERIRADYPNLKTLGDHELWSMIASSIDFAIQRKTRIVVVSARNADAETAQAIANAYADTAALYSMDENQKQSEDSVAWLKATAEDRKKVLDQADAAVLKFRTDNQLDMLVSQNDSLKMAHHAVAAELARTESDVARAAELLSVLTEIQNNPEKVASLPENVPRAAEISASQAAIRNAVNRRNSLLTKYKEKHPEVVQVNMEIEALNDAFRESIVHARETAAANLDLMTKQMDALREKQLANVKTRSEIDIRITEVENRLKQLERERDNANSSYQSILRRIEEYRLSIDDISATITVLDHANLPTRPLSPDPRIAFSAGPTLGLLLGFIFILVLDRIEDNITSSDDIERHMGTKVLSILPHVPRITRNQLVSLAADKKFSRFSEAFAGLRGLLESPRYAEVSKCILLVSTQPEEGKTITSSNLAVSYSMAGKKTLLIDFDLRRPRIGRMFGKADGLEADRSLIDVLDSGNPAGFEKLPIESGYENLDLVMSRPSSHISPASVIGSAMLPRFFEWARKRYDHILVDSPPFGLVSDVLALGPLCDSAIIVCRPEKSKYNIVRHALLSLTESGTRVIGVVVNDVNVGGASSFSTSYNGYSSGYGYSYGKYGRYGRYGYGGGYYKRSVGDESSASAEDGEGKAAPAASELDVDDE